MRETIHALAHRYHGEWEAMTEALRRGEKPPAIPAQPPCVNRQCRPTDRMPGSDCRDKTESRAENATAADGQDNGDPPR